MTKIEKLLKKLKKQKRKALSIFLTAGYPDVETTERLIIEIDKYVDLIELGVPFSDPIADGPTIQESSQKSLEKKTNLKKIFPIVKNVKIRTNIPIILMGYLNPIYRFGIKKFLEKAKKVGVDGLIIPDLTYEESTEITKLAKKYNIAFIPLISLTTPENRAKKIAESSTGFVYVTAVTGITGARKDVSNDLIPYLAMLRSKTKKPLLVGFGISKPEHIKKLKNYCDGFIVGSAVIELIRQKKSVKNFLKLLTLNL
ncbi:MAG: tryptophan synthase subunit alpha [Elusimicrobia bacterium CG06_land_8_20_14_3_00_38_11]|nr:MAG: tryptophan synthase subunit alpha [Elusimicrobia bacterium CG06_land_8_20_14_3_00_38_11]